MIFRNNSSLRLSLLATDSLNCTEPNLDASTVHLSPMVLALWALEPHVTLWLSASSRSDKDTTGPSSFVVHNQHPMLGWQSYTVHKATLPIPKYNERYPHCHLLECGFSSIWSVGSSSTQFFCEKNVYMYFNTRWPFIFLYNYES